MRTYFLWMGHLSRRRFCRSSVAVASTLVVGSLSLPVQANAARGVENIQVSHDSYPFHAEPFLAVNPRNPRNLLGIAQLFQSVEDPHLLGTFVSFDGGKHWQDNGPLTLPSGTNYVDNITVAFDRQGVGFVVGMATTETQGALSLTRGVYAWRTEDGGRTFHDPVTVMQGNFVDYPWIAIEPTTFPHKGAIYVSWISPRLTGLSFSRSLDSGHSFEPWRTILTPAGGMPQPALAAGPHGLVCVAYKTWLKSIATTNAQSANETNSAVSDASPSPNSQVEVIVSTDAGNSFGAPFVLGQVPDQPMPAPQTLLTTGPTVAIDPLRGYIYAAYAAYRAGTNCSEIVVRHSRDRGQHWSDPIHLTGYPDSDQASYFQPQLSIDDTGHVAVSAFVFSQRLVDVVLAVATHEGANFGAYRRITNQSFNPAWGPAGGKHGNWWIGDFQGLASSPGQFHAFWNDTRTGIDHMDIFTATVDIGEFR